MAIHASFQGLGALGYEKYGDGPSLAVPTAKKPLAECIAAAKALLFTGKAGKLPAQCYTDSVPTARCGTSCRDDLRAVSKGTSARMLQNLARGDGKCLANAMDTTKHTAGCAVDVGAGSGGAKPPPPNSKSDYDDAVAAASDAFEAATTAAENAAGGGGGQKGGGASSDQNYQEREVSSPWPLRIGIGAGVGALVAGALYMKYGRG